MDNALLITLIGMSLVFAAIITLWLLMAVLTRILPTQSDESAGDMPTAAADMVTPAVDDHTLRARAAAVAVAVALAMQQESENGTPHFLLPPTALVSPWQAVARSKMIHPRSPRRRN